MKHIQKIIENELKKMVEEDRELFRKTALKTYEFLTNDISKKMKAFEEKILDSAITKEKECSIINILVPTSEIYLYEEHFAPVISDDISEISLKEILESEEKIYKKVILNTEKDKATELENERFQGSINLNGKDYNLILKLEKDNSYLKKIEELYHIFELNNLEWRTVNAPYLKRIYKLKIIDFPEEIINLLDSVSNKEIIIDKKIDNRYWIENHTILWNIHQITMLGNGEIEPTKDRVHYEHTLYFNKDERIFLSPSEEVYIYYIQKIKDGFRIITDENKNMSWEFIKIIDVDEIVYHQKIKNKVFSNKVKMDFINKLRFENKVRLRNFAEIQRVVNSYSDVIERMELKKVEISSEIKENIKYDDLNYFILDEFKLKGNTSNIYFYFKLLKSDIYTNDIFDFILSELQLYFPEYKCRGVLM